MVLVETPDEDSVGVVPMGAYKIVNEGFSHKSGHKLAEVVFEVKGGEFVHGFDVTWKQELLQSCTSNVKTVT